MITFVDRDGDTVKISYDEVVECLRKQGNPPGGYVLVPKTNEFSAVGGNAVVGVRAIRFPKYSRFVMWRKRRKGSKLLERQVKTAKGVIKQDAERVWLNLKGTQAYPIFID